MRKLYFATTLTALSLLVFSNVSFAQNFDKSLITENTAPCQEMKGNCEKPKIKDCLNLTPEQHQKAKAMRECSKCKIMPLIEQMKAEKAKFEQLKEQKASQKDIAAQKAKLKELHKQMQQIREANMNQFETILTAEQKVKFEKFREERKAERKNKFEGKREHHGFDKD